MAYNDKEVFLTSSDDFVLALVNLPDEGGDQYRRDGLWEPVSADVSKDILDGTSLHPIDLDALEDLLEVWDESEGISPETDYKWLVSELQQFIK